MERPFRRAPVRRARWSSAEMHCGPTRGLAGMKRENKTNKNRFIFRRQLRSPSSSCASAVGVARVQVRSLAACTFDQRFVIGPSRFFFACPTSTWHCSHANRSSFAYFIPLFFLSLSPFPFIPGLFFSPFFLSVSRWQLCRDVDTHMHTLTQITHGLTRQSSTLRLRLHPFLSFIFAFCKQRVFPTEGVSPL